MAKKVVIDLDASKLASVICRKDNSFNMSIQFKDKTTGAVINITTDTFLMEVKDSLGATVLSFSAGNGVTIINNTLYLSKTAIQMNVVPGVYTYGLYRTTVSGVVQTRLHGDFEVIDKNAER
jgi:hypothetical protein